MEANQALWCCVNAYIVQQWSIQYKKVNLRNWCPVVFNICVTNTHALPHMEYTSQVLGGSFHCALLYKVESKNFTLSGSPFIAFNLLNIAALLPPFLSHIVIFMMTALLNYLTECYPSPEPQLSANAHSFSFQTPLARVNQSFFHSFSCQLQNRLFFMYILNMTCSASKWEYQDTCHIEFAFSTVAFSVFCRLLSPRLKWLISCK